MKIESISRKISGFNYDNLSAIATLDVDEDPIEAAKKLDAEVQKMLNAIMDKVRVVGEARAEKQETISLLKRALEYAEKEDLPF